MRKPARAGLQVGWFSSIWLFEVSSTSLDRLVTGWPQIESIPMQAALRAENAARRERQLTRIAAAELADLIARRAEASLRAREQRTGERASDRQDRIGPAPRMAPFHLSRALRSFAHAPHLCDRRSKRRGRRPSDGRSSCNAVTSIAVAKSSGSSSGTAPSWLLMRGDPEL